MNGKGLDIVHTIVRTIYLVRNNIPKEKGSLVGEYLFILHSLSQVV